MVCVNSLDEVRPVRLKGYTLHVNETCKNKPEHIKREPNHAYKEDVMTTPISTMS